MSDLCSQEAIQNVLFLVGLLYQGIRIITPIILIIVGMIQLVSALASQDDKQVKTAQKGLVTKAVIAVCIFLIASIVGFLMGIVGSDEYKPCFDCVQSPFNNCPQKTIGN